MNWDIDANVIAAYRGELIAQGWVERDGIRLEPTRPGKGGAAYHRVTRPGEPIRWPRGRTRALYVFADLVDTVRAEALAQSQPPPVTLDTLTAAVLEWWKAHEYDETGGGDGDTPRNLYDVPPGFVTLALRARAESETRPDVTGAARMLADWVNENVADPACLVPLNALRDALGDLGPRQRH